MAAPITLRNIFKRSCFKVFAGRRVCFNTTTSSYEAVNADPVNTDNVVRDRSLCMTTEADVTLHSNDHEGLFFPVSPEDTKLFYTKGQSKHLGKMFKAFNETAVMVRQPMLDMKSLLSATDYNLPVIRYVLYGHLGCGKSLTMAYVMHYCAARDWLLIHMPWAANLTRTWREYEQSPFQPGKVDHPVDAADWLSYFYTLNKPFIEKHQPVVDNAYTWTKREKVEPGTPWTEIIEFGIARNKYAADAVGILFKEIKAQANAKKYRVLVAVDGVNSFWEPSLVKQEDNKQLKYEAGDLTLVHYFKKLLRNDWTNGAVVCTVDERASTTFKDKSFLPIYLLGQQGFEFMDPFIPIELPHYSEKEARSQLQYYSEKKWIHNPKAMTDKGIQEILFLSNRNPYELYRVTRGH